VENNYKTKDLYLAAVLKTVGYKIKGLEGENNKKFFIFENEPKIIKKDVAAFYNNELKGSFKELYDNVQALKDWIKALSK
jgi:hypothetical protein